MHGWITYKLILHHSCPTAGCPGLASLGTAQLEPDTCSSRTCERGEGRKVAAWVTRQQVDIGLRHTGVQTATVLASHCVSVSLWSMSVCQCVSVANVSVCVPGPWLSVLPAWRGAGPGGRGDLCLPQHPHLLQGTADAEGKHSWMRKSNISLDLCVKCLSDMEPSLA